MRLAEGWDDLVVLPFVLLLAGTGLMRLVEVFVSVRRMRARPDAVVAEPALFPVMAALHVAFVVLPIAEVALLDRPFVPVVGLGALAMFALACALRVWTLGTIGRAWNVRVVVPEADAIATTGPYRWIRHPNYLVVILELAFLPLVHSAWGSAIVLTLWNAAVLFVRIRTEEATLMSVPAWREKMGPKARFLPGVF
jgi:methyltransferase